MKEWIEDGVWKLDVIFVAFEVLGILLTKLIDLCSWCCESCILAYGKSQHPAFNSVVLWLKN